MINSLLNCIENLIFLSPTEKEIVTSLFKERTYKKGDFFLAEGQICKQVGFVAKGLLRYYINHEGEQKTYAFAQENNFVCNYESFLPQAPSSKIIQALEDCHIVQISFTDQGDYSFHYIKGIRDIFSGLLLCVFVLLNQRRALGMTLLAGTLIPTTDMLIVLSKPYNGVQQAIQHIIAIVICFVFGIILLVSGKPKTNENTTIH